jgi:hypothetical protein
MEKKKNIRFLSSLLGGVELAEKPSHATFPLKPLFSMARMSPAGDYYNRMVLGLIKDYEGNLHSFQVNRIFFKSDVKRGCHRSFLRINFPFKSRVKYHILIITICPSPVSDWFIFCI